MVARVLIIDDDRASRELAAYLLDAFGHSVRVAENAEDGIRAAQDEAPDLVICDLQMPGLDGYGALRRLREMPSMRGIPVIAVTASSMPEDRSKTRAAGFDGYLSKPITPESFVIDIEQFLPPAQRTAGVRPAK